MRFWLYVEREKHSFVEGERVPQPGEIVLFRDDGNLVQGVVYEVQTEIMGGHSDVANPVGMIGHVFVKKLSM
jgi:hypothetical protein